MGKCDTCNHKCGSDNEEYDPDILKNKNTLITCFLRDNPERIFNNDVDLTKVTHIHLEGANIDDDYFIRLAGVRDLQRLKYINIKNNPKLTRKAIIYIAKCEYFATVASRPQLCGVLGVPSATIEIVTDLDTNGFTLHPGYEPKLKSIEASLWNILAPLINPYTSEYDPLQDVIPDEIIERQNNILYTKSFHIKYEHPKHGYKTSTDASNGIRYIEFSKF
jgi:hypothetical protein